MAVTVPRDRTSGDYVLFLSHNVAPGIVIYLAVGLLTTDWFNLFDDGSLFPLTLGLSGSLALRSRELAESRVDTSFATSATVLMLISSAVGLGMAVAASISDDGSRADSLAWGFVVVSILLFLGTVGPVAFLVSLRAVELRAARRSESGENLRQTLESLKQELAVAEARKKTLEDEVDTLDRKHSNLTSQTAAAKQEIESLDQQVSGHRQTLDSLGESSEIVNRVIDLRSNHPEDGSCPLCYAACLECGNSHQRPLTI